MFRWLSSEPPRDGLSQRQAPPIGLRPTVRFAVALAFTVAYVAFAVYVSAPWRGELREAIGPVMAWVIPTLMAYIPSVVIGFLIFTLLTLHYRVPPAEPPTGSWPKGDLAPGDCRHRRPERGARDCADPGSDLPALLPRRD